VMRDAKDGIPYDVATRLLAKGVIAMSTQRSNGGLASMIWRVWVLADPP